MTFDDRVALFLAGFTGAARIPGDDETAAAVLLGRVEELAAGRVFDLELDPLAVAGFVHGLHDCFPDSPVWVSGPAAEFLESQQVVVDELSEAAAADVLVVSSPEILDFWVARWGAGGAGSPRSLLEIIRRARHRDGSTAAIVASSDACALLATVADHPLVAAEYARLGFDPSRVEFGNMSASAATPEIARSSSSPTSTSTLDAPGDGAGVTSASSEPASADLASLAAAGLPDPPASSAAVLLEGASPALAGAAAVYVDAAVGRVRLSLLGPDREPLPGAAVTLGITATGGLVMVLTGAIRALLIPAEGYQWVDSTADPLAASSLVCHDPFLARGRLPLVGPEWGGPGTNEGTPENGPWLHAELRQGGAQAQESGSGQYLCRIYSRVGGDVEEYSDVTLLDIHDAKFEIATRVRAQLAV